MSRKLAMLHRISKVNQPNVTKFCDKAFSELRATFPIIPKDLAKWKCFTNWKILFFLKMLFGLFVRQFRSPLTDFWKILKISSKLSHKRTKINFHEKSKNLVCKVYTSPNLLELSKKSVWARSWTDKKITFFVAGAWILQNRGTESKTAEHPSMLPLYG